MDYEKKYKEALERAMKLKENPQSVFNEYSPKEGDTICDYIFPELRESEDERVRKGLITAVSATLKGNKLFFTDVTREEALAWLEKQGEKKPQRIISAEAKEAMYNKPAWSEEDEVYLNTTIAYLKDAKEFKKTAENCIDWLKKLKQRIGGKQ